MFRTWKVTGPWHEPGEDLSARAGIAPDGELAWMSLEIGGPPDPCTEVAMTTLIVPLSTAF